MSQTVTQNSALSQTESSVQCAHPNPACLHIARALRPGRLHSARWASCHGAQSTVSKAMLCRVVVVSLRARARWRAMSQCLGLPCRSLPARDTKIVSRHKAIPFLSYSLKLFKNSICVLKFWIFDTWLNLSHSFPSSH